MNSMDIRRLFHNGEYVVIYPDVAADADIPELVGLKYLWDFRAMKTTGQSGIVPCSLHSSDDLDRLRSLLVIVPTPPSKEYAKFQDQWVGDGRGGGGGITEQQSDVTARRTPSRIALLYRSDRGGPLSATAKEVQKVPWLPEAAAVVIPHPAM
ncbi:unnamed protein product, partial [Cyprideis torosa]